MYHLRFTQKNKSVLYSPTFLTMALANFFTVSGFACFFLLPLFITEHGGTIADVGIIMGIFAFASILCRPVVSEMVDRIGRKKSYTIGCLIMSVLPLSYLLFKGEITHFYLPLLIARFFHGAGLAVCFTSVFTYIADITPETRLNEGVGIFGVTGLIGMAVGPIIGEAVIKDFGFSAFFLVAAGMAIAGLLFHLPLPESSMDKSPENSPTFFKVFMRRKIFMIFCLAFLFGVGLAAFGGFISPYARERHISFISLYYIAYSSGAVLTRFFGGKLADRIGEDKIIPPALILTGTGLLILFFLGGNFVLFFSGLVSGCGHGFLFPGLNAIAIRGEPAYIRGKIIGIFTGGIDTGTFAGSIILGYLGKWMGFKTVFFVAGLALIGGLGIYKILSAHLKKEIGANEDS